MIAEDEKEATRAGRNSGQSIRRALALLDQVAQCSRERGRGCSLTELAGALRLDKSTVSRLGAPLLELDLLRRDPATGRYLLGHHTLRLGQDYLEGLDLREVAASHLDALLERTGSTCHLVVREGFDVVYVDKKENTAVVRMASRIGHRLPLSCTAVGKAMMAASPPELTDAVITAGLPSMTTKTLVDPGALRADLKMTRRRGYAIDDGENEPEVRCVAAPVFDHLGQVAGAVSVSSLASHASPARVRELGAAVRATGGEISAAMGARHRGGDGPVRTSETPVHTEPSRTAVAPSR